MRRLYNASRGLAESLTCRSECRSALILWLALAALPAAANEPHTLSEPEIETLKDGFAHALYDPESARFTGMTATVSPTGLISVCGYVNAKNRFGGYVGATPFFGSFREDGFEVRTIAQGQDEAFRTAEYCRMFGIWP